MEWFLRAAAQGSEFGLHNVGDLYYDGYGVERDYAEAYRWLLKAAQAGHAGRDGGRGAGCCLNGEGVERDESAGAAWLRKSAENGHKGGMKKLAECLEQGVGAITDINEARLWREKAG